TPNVVSKKPSRLKRSRSARIASRKASKNSRDGNRIGEGAGTRGTLLQTSDRKKAFFRGARAFDVTRALAVLRRAMPAWRAPVVAAFARERRDPFSILVSCRSEERRVGKECRCRWWRVESERKERVSDGVGGSE